MSKKVLYINSLLADIIARKTKATALFQIHSDSNDPEVLTLLDSLLSDIYEADAKINILKHMLESVKTNNEN